MTSDVRTEPVAVPGQATAPKRRRPDVPRRTPPKPQKTSRKKLEKKIDKAEADLARSLREGQRLRWFVILMVTTWPVGLIWGPWWAAYIATGWFCFWGVGHYLNFFHRRNSRIRLAEAKEDLAGFLERAPTASDGASATAGSSDEDDGAKTD